MQIDTETNQVMSVPTQVIARNLQVMAEELKLSNAEIKVMQQGEPLTFVMQDEPVTVGISLYEKDGIHFCQGDAKKWSEKTKREWDKYTFGCYGCWMMDDNGNLDYIGRAIHGRTLERTEKECPTQYGCRTSQVKPFKHCNYGTKHLLSRRSAHREDGARRIRLAGLRQPLFAEWQEELVEYCKAHSLTIDDAAAEQFVHYKSEQLEAAMESGEA